MQFTEEDFDQVLSGNFVTKVIYLPDPEFQELALAGVETLVSTRLDPGVDPIAEADRRGSILAILRMGNKDLEAGSASNRTNRTGRAAKLRDRRPTTKRRRLRKPVTAQARPFTTQEATRLASRRRAASSSPMQLLRRWRCDGGYGGGYGGGTTATAWTATCRWACRPAASRRPPCRRT